jgi:hypothetical protein
MVANGRNIAEVIQYKTITVQRVDMRFSLHDRRVGIMVPVMGCRNRTETRRYEP